MIDVEQGLFDQPLNVFVLGRIEHAIAIAANPDQPGGSEFGQLLRYGRSIRSDMVGQLTYGVLAVEQCPQDFQARDVTKQFESLDGKVELSVAGLERLSL